MSFPCETCQTILKHKQSLIRHSKICKSKREQEEKDREKDREKEQVMVYTKLEKHEKVEKKLRDENKCLIQKVCDLKKELDSLKLELSTKMTEHKEELDNIIGHRYSTIYENEGLKKENALLKIQNAKHVEKLYNMASMPKVLNQNTVTTNNTKLNSQTINNVVQLQPFDLNDEKIKEQISITFSNLSNEKFEGYLKEGQQGMASAVFNEVFLHNGENNSYHTADSSRHIFEYKNTDGQIVKDNKAFKLSKLVHAQVINRTRDVTKKHLSKTNDYDLKNIINQRLTDISILPNDNKKFCNHLVKMIENN